MSRELTEKKSIVELDGFEGFEDAIEGGEKDRAPSLIQGTLVKFTNEGTWTTREGDELSSALELVAIDIRRVVQKWIDGQPVETMELESGQKWPDIDKLNAKAPRKEWSEGFDGEPRGPWQAQYLVYLLDPKTMARLTYATGTRGGGIAVRDLAERTKWMRLYCGDHVYPVIALADVFMRTKFGGRQRPHFDTKRWVALGSDSPPQLTGPKTVTPPTARDVTDDEIPF
jgi:hypothetical protein